MSKKVTHIVHKLNLDIEVSDERLARKMYQQAASLLQQYVLPKLEEILRQYDRDDLHIRLDQLNIDLTSSGNVSLEELIKEQLAEAIGKELQIRIHNTNEEHIENRPVKIKGAEALVEAFLWFLEYGYLPWWVEKKEALASSQDIIDAITIAEEAFAIDFVDKLQRNPAMLKRLLAQYDAVLLTYLFSLVTSLELFSVAAEYESFFVDKIKRTGDTQLLKLWYWQNVWDLCSIKELFSISGNDLKLKLESLIEKVEVFDAAAAADELISTDTDELPFTDSEYPIFSLNNITEYKTLPPRDTVKDNDPDLPVDEDDLLGSNAGLILLHPFLQYFFQEFDLLKEGAFKSQKSCGIAVHLLHYLATGQEQVPDFDLLFEKYLCGMKAGQIINRYVMLTDKMKSEAEALLQSVIRHWAVLKNTSVAGLQESFLQRKGKLITKEDNHKIIMEQSSLDILLQQIPWNISLVKFPWMKQLIHVEWAM